MTSIGSQIDRLYRIQSGSQEVFQSIVLPQLTDGKPGDLWKVWDGIQTVTAIYFRTRGAGWILVDDGTGAWPTYTPTFTAENGLAIGGITGSGSYRLIDEAMMSVRITWTVSSVGSANGGLIATLPVDSPVICPVYGWQRIAGSPASPSALAGLTSVPVNAQATWHYFDNTSPIVLGTGYVMMHYQVT